MSWRARGGIQDSHQMIRRLLCPSTKASSLNGLIDLTFDVAFQGSNELGLILLSVVRPRLSTTLSVFLEKQSWRGLYLLSCHSHDSEPAVLDTVYSQIDTTAARWRNHCPGQL